jgi:hypothetical protein
MGRQTSVQLIENTERQVRCLQEHGYGSFTDIVRIAIDRMYRDEITARMQLQEEEGEMYQTGNLLRHKQTKNLYVVTRIQQPPAGSTATENVVEMAMQARGDGRALDPSDTGITQWWESDLDEFTKL